MEEKIAETTARKSDRNYGVDLLRIVSMLMVLTLHVLGQGGTLAASEAFTLKGEVLMFLEITCFCAVNVYAMISGFVGYNRKPKLSRLLSIWIEVLLYSAVFGTISFCYRTFALQQEVGLIELIKCFFPFFFNNYWYFSAYVILFMLMPLLNVAIEKTPKNAFRGGLLFVVLAYGFVPNNTFGGGDGYTVIWILLMYLVGGYLGKYRPFEKARSWVFFLGFFASVSVDYCSRWVAKWVGLRVNILVNYQSIFIVLAAACLLLGFSKLKIGEKASKIVAFLSPMAFGVYIIHLSKFIWADVLANRFSWTKDYNVAICLLVVVGSVLALYLVCSLMDFCRIKLFKLLRIDNACRWIEGKLLCLQNFVDTKILKAGVSEEIEQSPKQENIKSDENE